MNWIQRLFSRKKKQNKVLPEVGKSFHAFVRYIAPANIPDGLIESFSEAAFVPKLTTKKVSLESTSSDSIKTIETSMIISSILDDSSSSSSSNDNSSSYDSYSSDSSDSSDTGGGGDFGGGGSSDSW